MRVPRVAPAGGPARPRLGVELTPLGEGTFGSVYKATVKSTGEAVALKKIKMRARDDDVAPACVFPFRADRGPRGSRAARRASSPRSGA